VGAGAAARGSSRVQDWQNGKKTLSNKKLIFCAQQFQNDPVK
jgi:hypothetical protein